MANVAIYNMEGKEVGTMELNDAVFGVEINEHLVHLAAVGQLANKRQGTQKLRPVLKFPERKKAVETERNRSCKTGFDKSSAVDRRWSCICSGTERLHSKDEQEREESCSEVRTDKQSTGEQVPGC